MKKLQKIAILVTVFINIFTSDSTAQSYQSIDSNLALYCADLPNATNLVVRIVSNNGLYTVSPVDPEAEKATIIKMRRDLQKRIKTLKSIKNDYEPSSDLGTLKKSLKFIREDILTEMESDASLDTVTPSKIYKKIGAMIDALKIRLDQLQIAIETIDKCVRDENLIPTPISASPEIIIFEFIHPDYGTKQIMRGLGISAILHKSRSYGSVCVGAAKVIGRIPVFPKEAEFRVNRNPCLGFYQNSFRNFPFCHYGVNVNSAVSWFSFSEPGFSQSAVTQSEMTTFENRLANVAPIHVRFPTKKNPCRN